MKVPPKTKSSAAVPAVKASGTPPSEPAAPEKAAPRIFAPKAGEMPKVGGTGFEGAKPAVRPPLDLGASSAASRVQLIGDKAAEKALASHWAPVFYQETDTWDPKADFITKMNYDGDWQSNNNWDNLHTAKADLKPAVYYAATETDTHVFIHYADFHPRDWEHINVALPFGLENAHENDIEGAMVVVEKDGTPKGKLSMVVTQAHGRLTVHTAEPDVSPTGNSHFVRMPIRLENGSHPALYVEPRGHGVSALDEGRRTKKDAFPSAGNGVIYWPSETAQVPKDGNDRGATYELRSMHDEVWSRVKQIGQGKFMNNPMQYEGRVIGTNLDGDDYADNAASPPWGWADGGSKRGDYFFRPAETMASWIKTSKPWSTDYRYNPYLDELKALREKGSKP